MINEKNSLVWQLYQLQQRFDEWWELKAKELGKNLLDLDLFSWLNNDLLEIIARLLLEIIITLILIWFSFKFANFFSQYFQSLKNKYNQTTIQKQNNNKAILSVHKWLERSHHFKRQGNYRDAIWCLYMAMLQKLNDQGIAPHQLSRTDGEYVQIIQTLPNFNAYQILLINHQKLLFANQPATLNMWEECERAFLDLDLNC
jgi:hypothetical protein